MSSAWNFYPHSSHMILQENHHKTKITDWENSWHLAIWQRCHRFPRKWRLRNKRRNSILMMRHYPVLGSASGRLNQISYTVRLIRSTTQTSEVTHHQYGISALVSQTSFVGESSGSVAKCLLFSQAIKMMDINRNICHWIAHLKLKMMTRSYCSLVNEKVSLIFWCDRQEKGPGQQNTAVKWNFIWLHGLLVVKNCL